jgi:hypothetical protein
MKRLFFILIITGLLIVPQSCEKDYLELYPTSAVSAGDVFTTTKNAWGAINGIHRLLYQQGGNMDQAGQSAMMIHNDFMGEDLVPHAWNWFVRSTRWMEHDNPNSGHVWHRYRFYYQVIANANLIIENIDGAVGIADDRDAIKGQALTYRAWAYFALVQFYADRYDWTKPSNDQLGVPLILTPTTAPQPRATVQAVYTQIKQDLTDAIPLLTGKSLPNKSHLSADVARGIMARVALATGDWGVAASMANAAKSGKELLNHSQLMTGFNNRNLPEALWACEVIADHTTYFHSYFAFMSFNFSSSNIRTCPKRINKQLYLQISDTDVRKEWWEETAAGTRARLTANGLPTSYVAAPHHSFKFQAVSSADSRGDVIYMRTAELYLMEAEALARNGQAGPAAQVLYDLVSTRDPGYVLSTNTGQALIDEVMLHRRIELWGEGFRWQDLKRTNSALDRTGDTGFTAAVHVLLSYPVGGSRWTSLFPIDEVNANTELVQNVHID